MTATYAVHIIAGCLSLIAGYIALYSTKGMPLHRRSGVVFVYAMLTMCLFGTTIATFRGVAPAVNVPAGVLTAYLVITALTTVHPASPAMSRWLHPTLMIVALAVGIADVVFMFEAFGSPDGKRHGMPAFPFIMFGFVGILGAAGDVRMMRSGPLQGVARLRRHLWRMSFALFIAALSFFIGQAKVFPKPIRILPLLAMPMLVVLVTMFYWLWRVRARRTPRSIAAFTAQAVAR